MTASCQNALFPHSGSCLSGAKSPGSGDLGPVSPSRRRNRLPPGTTLTPPGPFPDSRLICQAGRRCPKPFSGGSTHGPCGLLPEPGPLSRSSRRSPGPRPAFPSGTLAVSPGQRPPQPVAPRWTPVCPWFARKTWDRQVSPTTPRLVLPAHLRPQWRFSPWPPSRNFPCSRSGSGSRPGENPPDACRHPVAEWCW